MAAGDRVATRFTAASTHDGAALMGFDLDGRRPATEPDGITIDRSADGRIAENRVSWDLAGLLEQLRAGG